MVQLTCGRPLQLSDRAAIEAALSAKSFHPAEYAFANLWLFRERHGYRWHDQPVPHIRGTTYDGACHALPLTALTPEGIGALFASGADCIYPLPNDAPTFAKANGYGASFDRSDSDYWFSASSLAALDRAKSRRQQARAFERDYAPTAPELGDDTIPQMFEVLRGWEADVGRSVGQTDAAECREAIAHAGELGLTGMLVRTGEGEPVAFLLASRAQDAATIHFAKGRRNSSHAYPWMFATFAAQCGATWINFEQDLGNPGFAQSKRAYGPKCVMPKYRLHPIKP